jgi:kynureninase
MATSESRMHYSAPVAIEHPDLVAYRSEFPILQRKIYLNSCSLGALSNRSMQGLAQFMEMWNEWGAHAWYEIWMGEIAKARQKFAAIIGAQVHEVAIAPSVSVALSSIATALDYSKRNNVVMADMDFPTLAYQWLVKERVGVECRFVESPDRVHTPPELFEAQVDSKTALVATSRVFFTSGYIQDVRAVADTAHKHGAYVLIDDYQGTGQIPIDVIKMDIDFPNLHLVRSLAHYLLVATYLLPPPYYGAVAFSTVVLSMSLNAFAVEGVSAHDH